jgi:integrase
MVPNIPAANTEAASGASATTPAPKIKLLDRVSGELRLRHYSVRTEQAYVHWIERYIRFCRDHPHLTPALSPPSEGAERGKDWWHPRHLGAAEVRQFLEHLAAESQVAATTQNQALNALVFLRLLAVLEGTHQLIGRLLYGSGMRLLEGLRVRVKDIDLARHQIAVRDGKGTRIGGRCCAVETETFNIQLSTLNF